MHTSFCVTGVSDLNGERSTWTWIHFPVLRLPARLSHAPGPAGAVKRSLLDGAEGPEHAWRMAGSASSFGHWRNGFGIKRSPFPYVGSRCA